MYIGDPLFTQYIAIIYEAFTGLHITEFTNEYDYLHRVYKRVMYIIDLVDILLYFYLANFILNFLMGKCLSRWKLMFALGEC